MKIVDIERPLDLAAAAEFLGCSTYTLADKAHAGLVRGVKCGGWKFMRQDLIDYVRGKNKQKPKPQPKPEVLPSALPMNQSNARPETDQT